LDNMYQDIAAVLHNACPAGYTKSWISAEVDDDWNEQEIWCETQVGKSQPDIDGPSSFRIGEKLQEIRRNMTVPGQKPSTKCTFTLFPDGTFKFDVDYDD
jgi:hypothetical protein